MAHMIKKREGRWALTPGLVPCLGRRAGRYRFDAETMCLTIDDGEVLARIVLQQIAGEPFPSLDACVKRPIVAVQLGEIMREIQNSENAGAYFVLPSQFNGAEYPDFDCPVSSLGAYWWDDTGGPRGQLAVHPAVGQFLLDNAARRSRPGGINAGDDLLQALHADGIHGFLLQNGYLRVPGSGIEAVKAFERHLWRLRTIAAVDVPAVGLAPNLWSWSAAKHRVSLVYASAVPVGTYNNPCSEIAEDISALAVRGAYYGALRLALEASSSPAKKTRVFLMPLGGGVFRNSTEAIATSLSEAVELASLHYGHEELERRLDVRLLAWDQRPAEHTEYLKLLMGLGKLREASD